MLFRGVGWTQAQSLTRLTERDSVGVAGPRSLELLGQTATHAFYFDPEPLQSSDQSLVYSTDSTSPGHRCPGSND